MENLFGGFQEFRKILCVCPCCGDLVRVSDLRLKATGPAAKTWLDDYEKKNLDMGKKEKKFGEEEAKLREKAVEKGRKAAEITVNNAILPELKALQLDLFDVKQILNPIDFVVFKDMTKKEAVEDIILLSKKVNNPQLNTVRAQVSKAIENKKYEWQVARIDKKGKILLE